MPLKILSTFFSAINLECFHTQSRPSFKKMKRNLKIVPQWTNSILAIWKFSRYVWVAMNDNNNIENLLVWMRFEFENRKSGKFSLPLPFSSHSELISGLLKITEFVIYFESITIIAMTRTSRCSDFSPFCYCKILEDFQSHIIFIFHSAFGSRQWCTCVYLCSRRNWKAIILDNKVSSSHKTRSGNKNAK